MIYRKVLNKFLTPFCFCFFILDMPTAKYFSCHKIEFDFHAHTSDSFRKTQITSKINLKLVI